MLMLIAKIAFVGSVGEPLPWVAAAILLRVNSIRVENRLAMRSRRRFDPGQLATRQRSPSYDRSRFELGQRN